MASSTQRVKMIHEDDIDNDLLIEEVEARPVIYSKNVKEYSNLQVKTKAWEEVCSKLFYNTWGYLSTHEKAEAVKIVQKRWKNIRACFSRELREQKNEKSEPKSKKRRKYKHFEQLVFLIASMESREASENTSAHLPDDGDEIENEASDEDHSDDEPRHKSGKKEKKRAYENRFAEVMDSKTAHIKEEKPIEIFKEERSEGDGDDREKHFALSLVPMLKAIPEEKKIDVQIQILQVFKNMQSQNPFSYNS